MYLIPLQGLTNNHGMFENCVTQTQGLHNEVSHYWNTVLVLEAYGFWKHLKDIK